MGQEKEAFLMLKSTPKIENVVGQLAKTHFPTPKPSNDKGLPVGRTKNDLSHAPTHMYVPLEEKIIQHQNRDKNPHHKRANISTHKINFFTRFVKETTPPVLVYFGTNSYLPAVKQVYLPLQYRLFKRLAECSARLHQANRQAYKNGILVNDTDYLYAFRVMKNKAPKKRVKIHTKGRIKLLNHLQTHYQERVFSVRSLALDTDYSKSYLKELVLQLAREGIIHGERKIRGKKGAYKEYRLIKKQL